MTTIKYTLNKKALSKEEKTEVSKYHKGFTVLSDTLTETFYNDDGKITYSSTYYIFKGSWTPYGACVKHNDRYVFARYSRYDSVSIDFTDFAVDCDKLGNNDKCFETKHFSVNDMTVKF